MKHFWLAAGCAAALSIGAAAPAQAESSIILGTGHGPGATVASLGSVTLDAADTEPYWFWIDYLGYSDGQNIDQLTGRADFWFTGATNGNKSFNFDFTLANTSVSTIEDPLTARLTVFGFNVDPNASSATSTGRFNISLVDPNNSGPYFGSIDVCFKDVKSGSNCNNGKVGLNVGEAVDGTLSLHFLTAPTNGQITLNNFVARYQGIEGIDSLGRDGSATARGNVVPEPATWAMMIGGFGLVGAAMRRKERATSVLA